MKTSKRIIAGCLAVVTLASLSGCSTSLFKDDVTKYDLVPQLTDNEVKEYYAKSMEFDSVVTKNLDVSKTTYETRDVTDPDKLSIIKDTLSKTENLLKQMEYTFTADNSRLLNEEVFHYIKSYLNDRKLSNGTVQQIKEALGYYFVDVQYDLSARTSGTFTNQASMVGLDGAFIHSNYTNTDSIDTAYMDQAVRKLNKYYQENNILGKAAKFDKATGIFTTDPNGSTGGLDFTDTTVVDTPPDNASSTPDTASSTPANSSSTPENNSSTSDTSSSTPENTTGQVQKVDENGKPVVDADGKPVYEDKVETPIVEEPVEDTASILNTRSSKIDIHEFNTVVGSSTKQSAYLPTLSKVYNLPAAEGTLSGIGIYPSGIGGLTKFGFNRTQLAGTVTMRYVYKNDLNNPNVLISKNVYPVFSEVTTGFSANNDNVVPEFLMTEFEKLIDNSDRAIANADMSALMSGNIYSDMGAAILRGYENQHVNVIRQMSTIRRVLSRDIDNSSYLIEIETLRQEGAKGADVYGTYRDKSYVVIEQKGQSFVITDNIVMTRQMQTEPDITPDSAVTKRLVALNLAGEVTNEQKEAAKSLLNDLYVASSNRVLNGPKEIKTKDGATTIERGMYDCFDQDPEMLSSNKKEEINSKLRGMLVKHGTGTTAKLSGIVTEWIGGANNQIEFTTEEVMTYQGRDEGIYMTCYYLISNMKDTWVIDDIQILSSEEHSGQALADDVARIVEK